MCWDEVRSQYRLCYDLSPLRPHSRFADHLVISHSFAWAELLIATATVFSQFKFELCGTIPARDVDVVRDCFIGQPSLESKGVRVRVLPVGTVRAENIDDETVNSSKLPLLKKDIVSVSVEPVEVVDVDLGVYANGDQDTSIYQGSG